MLKNSFGQIQKYKCPLPCHSCHILHSAFSISLNCGKESPLKVRKIQKGTDLNFPPKLFLTQKSLIEAEGQHTMSPLVQKGRRTKI